MMRIKIIPWILGAAVFAACGTATEKKYEPNENQALRLQLKHKDAEMAFVQAKQAQDIYTKALNDLTAEGEKVKGENKWPVELVFNPDKMSFAMPPPPPKPAPAKPDEKKK
jgi:hypothetical protein